jgi:CheY-like chemotaxis protein
MPRKTRDKCGRNGETTSVTVSLQRGGEPQIPGLKKANEDRHRADWRRNARLSPGNAGGTLPELSAVSLLALGVLNFERLPVSKAQSRPRRRKQRHPRVRSPKKTSLPIHLKKGKAATRRRVTSGKSSVARRSAWPASLRGSETVVIVEENLATRHVLVRLLKRLGYHVLEAASGLEARGLAASERNIDLVLADFSALGTSGVELVRWFSANRPGTKVLVAADWLWEVESCLGDLPGVGVLAKQFTPAELARMVRAILE